MDGADHSQETAGHLKLERARVHVDQLKDDIDAYLRGEPYEVMHEPVSGGLALRLRVHAPPPAALGLIVGDAVHNMRSALDAHLVTLAERLSGPLSEEQERWLQVPTGKDSVAQQTRAWDKHLRTAAPRLRRVVEPLLGHADTAPLYWAHRHGTRAEDEQGAHRALAERLRRLTWLSNIDKHRRLHLLWLAPGSLYASATTDSDFRWGVMPAPWSDGDEVARVVGPRDVDDVLVSAHASLALCLPGEPVGVGLSAADELDALAWYVEQALRAMDFAATSLLADEP